MSRLLFCAVGLLAGATAAPTPTDTIDNRLMAASVALDKATNVTEASVGVLNANLLDQCLIRNNWRTQTELDSLTADQKRNTVIVFLSRGGEGSISYMQSKNNNQLKSLCEGCGCGKGVLDTCLIRNQWRTKEEVADMSEVDKRNTVMVEMTNHMGESLSDMQGMNTGQLVKMCAQYDWIPDDDVALAKVATQFAWAAYYPGNKGRYENAPVCYGKYKGKSNDKGWPGLTTESQEHREEDCEEEVDGWEFQGKIEVATGSAMKLFEGSATADIYYKGSSCFIAIAGTDDKVDGTWSDTIANINWSPDWIGSHKQYAVGKGNNDYYLALQPGIQMACAGKTTKIATGHSLGAGAAEICVAHGDATRFFAFGPPKVWLAQDRNGKVQNNRQIRRKRATGGQATCTKDKDFLFPDSYSFYACDRTWTVPGTKGVKARGGCVGRYDTVPASGFGTGGGVHCAKTVQLYKDEGDEYGLELMRPDQPFSATGSNVGWESAFVMQIHPEPTSYLPWMLGV